MNSNNIDSETKDYFYALAFHNLERMHYYGFIHGDFHYGNILIDLNDSNNLDFNLNNNKLLIIDFGRSKELLFESIDKKNIYKKNILDGKFNPDYEINNYSSKNNIVYNWINQTYNKDNVQNNLYKFRNEFKNKYAYKKCNYFKIIFDYFKRIIFNT